MIDGQDKIEIYTDPFIQEKNVNIKKNSSGLSGGAIAAIVILSTMDLIIVSIVCLMVIKSRIIKNSGPNIVGLKTPEN